MCGLPQKMDTKKVVLDALEEIVGVEVAQDEYDLNLIEAGVLDSLSVVNLIVEIENAMNVRINVEKISVKDFSSVNSMIALVNTLG